MYTYNREVLGMEPIKITLSPSLSSFIFSGFAFAKSPESNPADSPELDLLPKALLPSPPAPLLTQSALSCAPQGQFVSFLKQALWNKDSQDVHLSTSPSC